MAMQSTDPLPQVVDPNFPGMGMDWLENSVEWLDDTWSVSCFLQVIPYVYLKRKLIHTKDSSTTILYNILTCSCVMWRVFFKQPCLWPGYRFKVILAKVGDFGLLTL